MQNTKILNFYRIFLIFWSNWIGWLILSAIWWQKFKLIENRLVMLSAKRLVEISCSFVNITSKMDLQTYIPKTPKIPIFAAQIFYFIHFFHFQAEKRIMKFFFGCKTHSKISAKILRLVYIQWRNKIKTIYRPCILSTIADCNFAICSTFRLHRS